jgi:Domain of unknown function (DUF4115)
VPIAEVDGDFRRRGGIIENVPGRHRKAPPSRHRHRGRHRKPPSRQLTVLPTVAVVALLAVGGVGLGHALANDPAHGASVGVLGTHVVAPPVTASPTVSPAPVPTSPPSAQPSTPAVPPAQHRSAPATLTVSDTGPACYVQVTTKDGHLLVRRILHGHQHLAFRQHGLDVVLGNAGGVRIAVDGHHAHRAGESGQVLHFAVN